MNQKTVTILAAALMLVLAGCTSPPQTNDSPTDDPDSDESPTDDPDPQPTPDSETPAGGSGEAEIVVQRNYTGAFPVLVPMPNPLNAGCPDVLVDPNPGGPENVGGACFEIPPEVSSMGLSNDTNSSIPAPRVHLSVEDDSGFTVGGYVRFYDENGELTRDNESFCNETVMDFSVDTAYVSVVVSEFWCLSELETGVATTGTITATFPLIEG